MATPVSLVLVTHSSALATGVRELVAQMAPDVTVATAGGLPDGTLGTDLERVQDALEEALATGGHAVVLYDLGSAVMTAEIAIELLAERMGQSDEAPREVRVTHRLVARESTRGRETTT